MGCAVEAKKKSKQFLSGSTSSQLSSSGGASDLLHHHDLRAAPDETIAHGPSPCGGWVKQFSENLCSFPFRTRRATVQNSSARPSRTTRRVFGDSNLWRERVRRPPFAAISVTDYRLEKKTHLAPLSSGLSVGWSVGQYSEWSEQPHDIRTILAQRD